MDAAHRGITAFQERGQEPVQMRGGAAQPAERVHELAGQGISGAGSALPHLVRIQQSFGAHDVSDIHAHVGGPAAQAAAGMGAQAYATGNHVAFGAAPDLHTAAHEAAHVVQQRAGVQLYGGVGQSGDAYERHADAVADLVVQGKSAEGLLDSMSDSSHAPGVQQMTAGHAVQRKLVATGDSAGFARIANSIIQVQQEVAIAGSGEVTVNSTNVQGPQTREATELVRVLQRVIGDSRTTTIEFVHGATSTNAADRQVLIGSYALSKVDLDDVAAFGSGAGISAASTLAHEIQEQYRKQAHGEAFGPAHASGIAAEEGVVGARRGTEQIQQLNANTIRVRVPYTYPDGRVVEVSFDVDVTTNQISNVTRTERR